MLGLERKLEPGIQRELVLVLGIQAELSFRCTSSQVAVMLRKLALGACDRELELLRKPSPLGDERGSVREIGLWDRMCPTLHFSRLSPTLC